MRRTTTTAALVAVLTALLLAGCAPESSGGSSGSSTSSSSSGSCPSGDLSTYKSGVLTIATDNPAYEPWFSDNKPTNGKCYESAVAFAVAKQLGYPPSKVTWTTASFNSVIAPTPKKYDFDINQVSISTARKKAVDFSTGYYDVAQAVVTYQGSPIAGDTSLAQLKSAKLGAQIGTTSYTAITNQIKPSSQPSVFDTNDLTVQSLKNHQIDGLVVDLPTAFYITAAQLTGGVIVGQLAAAGSPEQFGLVLAKDSALTTCVSKAVDTLRSNGTLTSLQKRWLANAGAPELS
ncbi:MAG: ABC transporter substrate-binding protein [Propionibacteriaceae bacterium]